MNEQIEACDCGYDDPKLHGIPGRWRIGCSQCGRCGPVKDSHDAIVAAWNADMKAIKAARDAKPEPPKRPRVCTGEWRVSPSRNLIHEEIVADSEGELITIARISGHHDLLATARLMAASKEMYEYLRDIVDAPESVGSARLTAMRAFLDRLDVDVD